MTLLDLICTISSVVLCDHQEKRNDGITILEGLSASGLRAVRYALEVAGVKSVTANDISADAYKMIQQNVEHNNVQHIVKPTKEDAG